MIGKAICANEISFPFDSTIVSLSFSIGGRSQIWDQLGTINYKIGRKRKMSLTSQLVCLNALFPLGGKIKAIKLKKGLPAY